MVAQFKTRSTKRSGTSQSPTRKFMKQALDECDALIVPVSGADVLSFLLGWIAVALRAVVAAVNVLLIATSWAHLQARDDCVNHGLTIGNAAFGPDPAWPFVALATVGLVGVAAAVFTSTALRATYAIVIVLTATAVLAR